MCCPISFPWPSPPHAAQPVRVLFLSDSPTIPCHSNVSPMVCWLFASSNPSTPVLCLYMLSNFSTTILCPQDPSGLTDYPTILCSSGLCLAPLLPAATTSASCQDALPPNAAAFISQQNEESKVHLVILVPHQPVILSFWVKR